MEMRTDTQGIKLFNAAQIRQWDAYTIRQEPVASIDLMERASAVFTDWFVAQFPLKNTVLAFCGPGNNGGDGLAVARMLAERRYSVRVFCCQEDTNRSEDNLVNLDRLRQFPAVPIQFIYPGDPLPDIDRQTILLDALFGSGLNRPLSGFWAQLIEHLNRSGAPIAAVDIPSGLFPDAPSEGKRIRATFTLSFERPKLAFLMAENQEETGIWLYKSIGLSKAFESITPSSNYLTLRENVKKILRRRKKHDHKGIFGHTLLVTGSYGKMGAAVLCAGGALRSGVGLVTVHIPGCGYPILQGAVPEAMVVADRNPNLVSNVEFTEVYKSVAWGPGLGTGEATMEALQQFIRTATCPLVLDADALNILAQHPEWLDMLPEGTILTPHPKEFERLFGETKNSFERHELQREQAWKRKLLIVLKGAFTCIATPQGECHFNSTGNPGMATGGSGDVLTGILAGLLAQGYPPVEASLLGVYLHGLAGDLAAEDLGQEALTAGDIGRYLGKAFRVLYEDGRI